MKEYSHAFDFAFEVKTKHKNPENISPHDIRYALIERAARISDKEIMEACDCFDEDPG